RLWKLEDGSLIGKLDAPAALNGVAFAMADAQLACAAADNHIYVYALPTAPDQPATMPVKDIVGHGGPVNCIVAAPAPDGSLVPAGGDDGPGRLWNVTNGRATKTFTHGAPVLSAAIRADSLRVATASKNNTVKLFDGNNQQPIPGDIKGDVRKQWELAQA